MKATKFDIYRDSKGNLDFQKKEVSYPSSDWREFLRQTNQLERLGRLNSMTSRKRSSRVNRLCKSADFCEWQKNNIVHVSSHLYGHVCCWYDGRIDEGRIMNAVLVALKNGQAEARYYPRANAKKPAHLHRVYVFPFQFTPIS